MNAPNDVATWPTIVGLEHELGVSVEGAVSRHEGAGALFLRLGAVGGAPCARDQFLENGGRLYLDAGDHPEYATPECSTLDELLAADMAGLQLLGLMAERAETRLRKIAGTKVRLRVLRNNVAPNGVAWGSHENYLVPASLTWSQLADGLASHLVSRIVVAGSGTIMARPGGEPGRFRLSQRAPFVGTIAAPYATTTDLVKPLVMTREEPLCDRTRFRRLQIVCGDACMSQTATFLKVGTTLVALRQLQTGHLPKLVLDDPVAALQRYSDDPSLRATASSNKGRVTALDVQHAWLEAAVRAGEAGDLRPEEQRVLPVWEAALQGLENDPDTMADRLDWVAKRAVLERLADREGLAPGDARLVCADLAYHDVRADRSVQQKLAASRVMRTIVSPRAVRRALEEPPATTRARGRATLIRLLRRMESNYEVDWHWLRVYGRPVDFSVDLDDPTIAWPGDSRELAALLRRRVSDQSAQPPRCWPWPTPDALRWEAASVFAARPGRAHTDQDGRSAGSRIAV